MKLIRLYGRVLRLLGPQKNLALLLACANIVLAAGQFAEPVLFGRVIDMLARAQSADAPPMWSKLMFLLLIWIGFGAFNILCGTLVALYADRLAHQRRYAVLTGYFEHALELPLAFHADVHSGRVMKVMLHGTDALWGLWIDFFRTHLATFISFLILLPLSLILNWRLGLLLMLLCAIFAVLTAFVLRRTEAMQGSVEQHYSELAERASDALGNVALVHSFTRLEAEVSELRAVVNRLLAAQIPVLSWWAVLAILTRAATTIAILSIILLGAWLFAQGLASIGEIVTFMGFATMLMDRLQNGIGFANRVFMEAPKLQQFFEVCDAVPAIRDAPNAVDPGRVEGHVRFCEVSFSYGGRRPAVHGLTFSAAPGEMVALVGPTGAGKSTALALLHRSFDPQSGTVEIDGRDIRTIKLAALRSNIGVVFQEGLLFDRSIAENLRIGRADATQEELWRAAERAQAIDFILEGEGGFEARVGERGRRLSGGERQRLSIARALLKDPPILILDEATSALDAATETKLLRALDEVMRGRTTFVIAHRLATIRRATRILVFDRGRIVESGSFHELVERGGRFAELARAQFLAPDVRGPAGPQEDQEARGSRAQ